MKTSRWSGCLLAALLFASPAALAQVVLEALPGEEKDGPPVPPAEAYDNVPVTVDKSWMQYNDPYLQAQKVISNPHRTADEVGEWFKGLAADLMTHKPTEIENKIRGYRVSFSEKGYREFVTYMRDAKVLDMVSLRGNEMSTIATADPAFTGSGPISGVYAWNLTLPLLISFYKLDENGEHKPVAGGNFEARATIIRTTEENATEGMVIDSWRVVRAGAGAR